MIDYIRGLDFLIILIIEHLLIITTNNYSVIANSIHLVLSLLSLQFPHHCSLFPCLRLTSYRSDCRLKTKVKTRFVL
jgi:hypothetical protein